jgi:HK97 gp10 family phage protein
LRVARVYLKGLPQLKAKLKRLKEQTAEDIKPTFEAAAQSIVDMMKRRVPVKTGGLRDTIGWTWGDRPKYSQKVTSVKAGGALVITIFAGDSKHRYAHLVEFGTKPHEQGGEFRGTEHPGTAPQPFFFSSYRAMRKGVKAMLRKAIKAAVKKAMT